MTDHSAVLATFDDVKAIKTRKVVQIICEAPIERYDEILSALGGYPHNPPWVAIARVDEKVAVVTQDTAEPTTETEAPKLKGGPLSKRAGMLCQAEAFQIYLCAHVPVSPDWQVDPPSHKMLPGAEKARWTICAFCETRNLRELDHYTTAGDDFERIEQQYHDSQRGWGEGASR